jgi:glyoxylase-like metal-dependent hydrolase (beta-lactamase superfamily II)
LRPGSGQGPRRPAGRGAGAQRGAQLRITGEIHQVGGGNLTAPEDAAIYLINFSGQAALVDAGCGRALPRLMDNIRACGVNPTQIDYLLLTHCHFDHTGGAQALRERLGCRILAHALEAPFLEQGDSRVTAATWYGANLAPFPVDLKISGPRAEIELGGRFIEALHTPGHSPGSVVYIAESDGLRILFAQDVHGPLHPDLKSDAALYRRSLEALLALDADVLCEGHFGVYRGKPAVAAFIRQFLPAR